MKKFSFLIVILLVFSLETSAKEDLKSWLGHYNYSEKPLKALAGYSMAMQWDLKLNKADAKGDLQGVLEINGQQTFNEYNVLAKVTKNHKLSIILKEVKNGFSELKSGDELFRLVKTNNKTLITEWVGINPLLTEVNEVSCKGCFVRD